MALNLKRDPWSQPNLWGIGLTALAGSATLLALIPLGAVLYYLVWRGGSQLNWQIFQELIPPRGNGLANAIAGTLVMVTLASLLSVPMAVLAAVYIHEFAPPWSGVIRFASNVLAGVPSIVIGIFSFGTVVLTTQKLGLGSFSAIAGGVSLGLVMLPIMVRSTEESLNLVPMELRLAAAALGASKFYTIRTIVLPQALPTITTGILLAIARASGETAPLIFTALSNQYFPKSLWEPTASLSVTIYTFATAPFIQQQQLAWAGALVLVGMILVVNIGTRLLIRRS